MLIRVAMVLRDIPGKPGEQEYWVPLPAYTMKHCDYDLGWALLDVPDADIPDVGVLREALQAPLDWKRAPKEAPPARLLTLWHNHLDGRYQEHAGRFRPTLVGWR